MQIEKGDRVGNESGRCPVSAIGADFNPFVDPYLADPYPFWLTARRTEPVFYSPELDYWVVTRYDDIKAIFADPETFSAGNAQNPITPLAPEAMLNRAAFVDESMPPDRKTPTGTSATPRYRTASARFSRTTLAQSSSVR